MEQITIAYRGFVLSYLKVPLMTGKFVVNIASEDLRLLGKISMKTKVIDSSISYDDAIGKAKEFIDGVLD
jgi:hypothetical protein